jgi:hypothetical protein
MTASYQGSWLWKTAMEDQGDGLDKQRKTLRDAYEKFHDNASTLAEQIRADLPDLTDHGADHFNGLWHLASKITGESYILNPVEAFVFGGAILLHDAGNCLAAYPGGLEAIRKSDAWRDVVAQWGLKDEALAKGLPDYPLVLLEVLRQLHPQQAKNLAKSSWIHPGSGSAKYLLENEELRNYYGPLMGEIAASHGEAAHEIEKLVDAKITTHTCLHPAVWPVDALKLAALLRVADAAHLDATRAPGFLYALTQPAEGSDFHWRFQSKMGIPDGASKLGELIFSTGGNTFSEAENAAWWLCYDACRVADNELRAADQILREHGRDPFALSAVRGISDPAQFARQIRTEGWHPVDTSLRISDVNRLVENFGGEKLYGDKPYLALRELLQNAADAVRAWRALENLGPEEGRIDVELEEKDGATWLHVTDDGIGMSGYVLTNVLLDFGKSLWGSKDLRREWPGLSSSGFQATGQFGIGFFSVFMLGEQVKVTSLRYGAGHDTCRVLEFACGLQQRPLLREPREGERLKRHGTRVSVKLKEDVLEKLLSPHGRRINKAYQLNEMVAALAPALDIAVRCRDRANAWVSCVEPNDWWEMADKDLLRRISPFGGSLNGGALLPVNAIDGAMLGRCSLEKWNGGGVLVVNGIYAGNVRKIGGLLLSKQNLDLARTQAIPIAGIKETGDWVNRQCQYLLNDLVGLNLYIDTQFAASALALGGDIADWPLVETFDRSFNQGGFRELAGSHNELWFVSDLSEYDVYMDGAFLPHEFELYLRIEPHCLFDEDTIWDRASFLNCDEAWLLSDDFKNKPQCIGEALTGILAEVWGDVETEEPDEPQIVGEVNGNPVRRKVRIFRKAS